MDIDWKQVRWVVGAGAVGGALSWIYSEAIGAPLGLGWLASLLASVLLGGGAAVLGVYLIAKTDTGAVLHALAFAMACGFAWRPVLEGAAALVEEQVTLAAESAIDESTQSALSASRALEAGGGGAAREGLEAAVSESVAALREVPRKTTTAQARSLRLEGVVKNIRSASGVDAAARIEGLREIGSAATAAGDYSLAAMSMSAIAELGGAADAPPTVKLEAAAAVEDLGRAGSLRRMPTLEVSSDVIRAALQPREARSAAEIFDTRFPNRLRRR